MKRWILFVVSCLFVMSVGAREHRGPPPLCPKPEVNCSPKPKCPPPVSKPCSKPCSPEDRPCAPQLPKPEPCCPPVCFERGFPTDPCCTPSAYSEPAAFDVRCGWDTFITTSFIYWEAIQEGMELGLPFEATITDGVLTAIANPTLGFEPLIVDFDYKPGFQIGLGCARLRDNWVLYAQYTWLHGTTFTSADAPTPNVAVVNGAPLPQDGVWSPIGFFPQQANARATHISAHWRYKIDFLDGQISRPFYSGTHFTLDPFFGLRGAWIRQRIKLDARVVPQTAVVPLGPVRFATYHSRGNGVGPRIGVNGNWLVGWGLRLEGNVAANLLFTSYDVKQNVDSTFASVPFPIRMSIRDFGVLRPSLDLSLGLGWGSYFSCRRFYWDLVAKYDCSVLWGQNMMRYLADLTAAAIGVPFNLYLQGLTVRTAFEF